MSTHQYGHFAPRLVPCCTFYWLGNNNGITFPSIALVTLFSTLRFIRPSHCILWTGSVMVTIQQTNKIMLKNPRRGLISFFIFQNEDAVPSDEEAVENWEQQTFWQLGGTIPGHLKCDEIELLHIAKCTYCVDEQWQDIMSFMLCRQSCFHLKQTIFKIWLVNLIFVQLQFLKCTLTMLNACTDLH